MKKLLSVFLIMIFVVSFVGCASDSNVDSKSSSSVSEEDVWPKKGLGAMLPKPDAGKIKDIWETDTYFSADVKKITEDDFYNYVSNCKDAGFNIDVEETLDAFSAFNDKGYKVALDYDESSKKYSISLDEPKIKGTFTWPTIGLATSLPKPDTDKGTIVVESSSQFTAYISVTESEFQTYINECIEAGFNIDYSKGEDYYSADNKDGVSLHLSFEGFNTMYVSLYAPDEPSESSQTENVEATQATTKSESKADDEKNNAGETKLVDGMRPSFKEALDSYEDFFDEYCEIVEKYNANPSDLSLLEDYTDYLNKYSETMSKMEALDDGNMNDAETKYYIEVTGRITEKLLEAAEY